MGKKPLDSACGHHGGFLEVGGGAVSPGSTQPGSISEKLSQAGFSGPSPLPSLCQELDSSMHLTGSDRLGKADLFAGAFSLCHLLPALAGRCSTWVSGQR